MIKLPRFVVAALASGAVSGTMALTAYFEGYSQTPYLDTGGVPTVCYGHTGPDVQLGDKARLYTSEVCRDLLRKDVAVAAKSVSRLAGEKLSPGEQVAYTSFVLNVGQGAFARSTLLKKLKAGHRSEACLELDKWVYDNGKKIKGLVNRRALERDICLGKIDVG